MSITQEEFKKLTRDDLEKLKFVLDSNWNVCVRWFWVKWDDWNDWKTILNWSVDPTTEWVDGDFYINTTSWKIFWPKATVWGTWTDLIWADWTNGTNWVDWNWISSIVLLSWDHSPWTLDTYRITYTDTTTFDFQVYNGADWSWSLVSVVWWTNISIDNTDPNNPVVNFWLWADENFVTDLEKTAIWTIWWKEDIANKWQANWYAPLWADSKISSTYLPSYVDDVIEVANYASLPVTWETWKIYITLDTNFEYRWSWSVYVEIKDSWETEQSLGVLINNATEKTTPVDTDMVWLMDSVWSNILKKVSWANIKATLKTYFDSLTTTLTNKTISLTNNTISWTKSEFDTACSNWNFVFTDWNQTIDWVKTFTSSPIVPTPTTDMEVATKKYVDDNAWWWASTQSTFVAWENIIAWDALYAVAGELLSGFWLTTIQKASQRFILPINTTIQFLKLKLLKSWSPTDNVIIRIETDSWWNPTWTLANTNATFSIAWTSLTTSIAEYNIDFTDFSLSAWTYHIVLQRSWVNDNTNNYRVGNYIWNINLTDRIIYTYNWSIWETNMNYMSFWLNSNIQALYSWCYKTDASNSSKINFIWFASANASIGNTVTVDTSWVSNTLTWLTIWGDYYLSNTPWAISTTPWTNVVSVWKAVSATWIEINTIPTATIGKNWLIRLAGDSEVDSWISTIKAMTPSQAWRYSVLNFTRDLNAWSWTVSYEHWLWKVPKSITFYCDWVRWRSSWAYTVFNNRNYSTFFDAGWAYWQSASFSIVPYNTNYTWMVPYIDNTYFNIQWTRNFWTTATAYITAVIQY